jgi:hypothetical protein
MMPSHNDSSLSAPSEGGKRAFGDPLFDLGEELFTGELAGGVRIGVVFLGHGHDEFEMDVQAELEHGLGGINDGGGQPAGAAA